MHRTATRLLHHVAKRRSYIKTVLLLHSSVLRNVMLYELRCVARWRQHSATG